MLVLTRKIGESIIIGDDIVITQLGVNGSQVRYGISAPYNVRVLRDELLPQSHPLSTETVSKSVGNAPKSNAHLAYVKNRSR